MQRIVHISIPRQINEIIESIKEARISEKPIQFIVTKDLNIINDIISHPRVLPQADRFVTRQNGKKIESSNLQYNLNFVNKPTDEGWRLENDSAISKPTLFVLRLLNTDSNSADYQNIFRELQKFIQVYSGVVRSQVVNSKTREPQEVFPAILKSSVLVLCPQVPELPSYVSLYSQIIKVKTPEGDNLKYLIQQLVKAYDGTDIGANNNQQVDVYSKEMERQLRGLSQTKIEQIYSIIKNRLQKVYFDDFKDENKTSRTEVKKIIQQEKQSFIESSDVLKLVECDDAPEPAGLNRLVEWLKQQKQKIICYNEEHQKRAASMPKGILMSGVPGSGKSLTARYVAKTLALPLLKLDFGDLLDKWQGNSEHRMQAALDTAIEMAPCVLWIDEIEKAFSGAQSSNEASSKRMISKFLTWMQDKEKEDACCFVFATANSIIGMPPELFRSGRFDAKFYTFLPSYNDCVTIFAETLKHQNEQFEKHNQDMKLFREEILKEEFRDLLLNENVLRHPIDSSEYTKETSANKFFTGSDITSLIELAKDICFSKSEGGETYKDELDKKLECVYNTNKFVEALKEALQQTKTYGETNFRECAEVFSQICYTNFLPAADPVLLTDSKCYDESRLSDTENNSVNDLSIIENRVYDMNGDVEKFTNEYDRQMYYLIRNSVNKNIRQFIMHRERR